MVVWLEWKKGKAILTDFVAGQLFQENERHSTVFYKSAYLLYTQWFIDQQEIYAYKGKNARMVHGHLHHCSLSLEALFVVAWTMLQSCDVSNSRRISPFHPCGQILLSALPNSRKEGRKTRRAQDKITAQKREHKYVSPPFSSYNTCPTLMTSAIKDIF